MDMKFDSSRPYHPNILTIAGTGRNVGKTTLACSIIKKMALNARITAIKITPHFHKVDYQAMLIKKDIKMEIGTRTIASLGLFLKRIKNTGLILYGKDFRKQIPKTMPTIEKIKASFNAMLLLMMSFVIFPFSSKSAFAHAIKANFWACDDVLFAYDKPLSTTKEEIKEICSIFDKKEIDSEHLFQSLDYKNKRDSMNLRKGFVFRYMLKSTKFVYELYALALKKLLLGEKDTKEKL